MKNVKIFCDLCGLQITNAQDHFKFVVTHQFLKKQHIMTVDKKVISEKITEKKELDFHLKCNIAFKSEFNNIMTMLQSEYHKNKGEMIL